MKASNFDKKFESGENITDLLDLTKTRRPGLEAKRVNVDFPEWMVESLDKDASTGYHPPITYKDLGR